MKVSLNTVKQFTSVDISIDELVARINQQLGGVEKVIDLAARYDGAAIVKVESCEKHPNADKLNVCMVNDGSGELTQVVCGAPNVHAGMFAVWLQPGSVVPSTADDAEPFILGARELRGVMSNGMLASPKELAIGDGHDGILEVHDYDLHKGQSLIAGAKFAELFGLNDTTIDIENKMFTHRPDLFGQLGVAREIAGIFHKPFVSPEWYSKRPEFTHGEDIELEVFNDAGSKVPRIMFLAMKNIEVKPSPLWLQCALVALGGKPINNIVDATNYIMLLTAQPAHAYDYDKLRGHTIGARMAKPSESIKLLNGKTYKLSETDIVIADGEGAVGLGGVMGGGDSEVSESTKNIVLEVATFDMYAVRKSSMRHGIFTDALTRFNKGQSPLQNPIVIAHLADMIKRIAGGVQAGDVHDLRSDTVAADLFHSEDAFVINPDFINSRLGFDLSGEEMCQLLKNVEIKAEYDEADGLIDVRQPFWRTDIELPEDIVEEVGRLYGFDKLPRELPSRSTKPAPVNLVLTVKQSARQALARSGANELLTYSFVHEKLFERTGQDKLHAFKLSNALSPDLQYYRLGLTPSLLDKIHMNIKAGYDKFALFEAGKVHYKGEMDELEPGVPNEDSHMALVVAYTDKAAPGGAAYFHALRYLQEIVDLSAYELVPLDKFDISNDEWGAQLTAAYEPARSAVITKDGQVWGVVGEYRRDVRRAFKLPTFTAGFEVHQDILAADSKTYRPLSRFPSVTQDVSIRTTDVPYSEVATIVHRAAASHSDLYITVAPTTIYRPEDGNETTTTFRLTVTSHESTLQDSDVRPIIDLIKQYAEEAFGGRVV